MDTTTSATPLFPEMCGWILCECGEDFYSFGGD
jgi:hypothetical protein